eukprot:scaffold31707_cov66-Phaeocystis_antarctica.AAC.2
MYDLLERLAPGTRKLELFGRPHNVHKGWTTLGNQLGKSQVAALAPPPRMGTAHGHRRRAQALAARAHPHPHPNPHPNSNPNQISEPWLRERLLDEGIFEEEDLAPMPPPPEDPFVPPWGGHKPPPRLNLAPAAPMSTD